MFDKFKNTKAIILDMRGYPSGTAWQIAPRLTDKDKVSATTISRPTVMYPDGSFGNLESADKYTFVIPLPNPIKPRYSGKTVMLIDERTVSQAEYSGLFYHAANGTKFIGTNTAGAGADVTNFFVPGGIRIYFSGQIYTYPDGTPVMGIGLVPDVRVSPTIKGIREGNDEILEKAIQYVQGELSN
jgi:C-terminal processing protease CtpA/Prc